MPHVAKAILLVWMASFASPGLASPLDSLQQLANRCFEAPGVAACSGFFDLSDRLRDHADHHDQLRCATSLLALEAVASKALRGIQEPARQAKAMQDAAVYCP